MACLAIALAAAAACEPASGAARCDVALAASRCTVRGRHACWSCLERRTAALSRAGCNSSDLVAWCQYGTCARGSAFASAGYCDGAATLEARADALVAGATLAEKASMLSATNAGIARLGVPAFIYTECLHGLKVDCSDADSACTAVFPAPVALAATLNASLWTAVGATIGREARALFNSGGVRSVAFPYCWAPNINLVRDGRWGRAGETSGEDVALTREYMLRWTAGLQQPGDGEGGGAGPTQALATCKHWSAYSLEGRVKHAQTCEPPFLPPVSPCSHS